jgi:hypothetical protein
VLTKSNNNIKGGKQEKKPSKYNVRKKNEIRNSYEHMGFKKLLI